MNMGFFEDYINATVPTAQTAGLEYLFQMPSEIKHYNLNVCAVFISKQLPGYRTYRWTYSHCIVRI